jgi:hypothetical protein
MDSLYHIPITIANILIDLTSSLSPAELKIEDRLGQFFGQPENPLMRIALRWKESIQQPRPIGKLIYDPGSIWKMYRDVSGDYAELTYHGDNLSAQAHSVLQINSAWDDLILTEQRTMPSWISLLNIGAGELILRTAILFSGGLVFHSSGLDDNGKGIVFIGHSGAGKSTQLGIWSQEPGVISMNDDRVAVRIEDNVPICYGTPWGGTLNVARNHSAPLSALVILEQSPENSIHPISPIEASSLLMARAFLPYWDRSLMLLAIANLNTILKYVPVFRLRCRPEREVIALVRSVI